MPSIYISKAFLKLKLYRKAIFRRKKKTNKQTGNCNRLNRVLCLFYQPTYWHTNQHINIDVFDCSTKPYKLLVNQYDGQW